MAQGTGRRTYPWKTTINGKDVTFRMMTPNTISIWLSHELCFGR